MKITNIILLLFISLLASAKEIKVCPTCTYKSITKAVKIADSNDVIIVDGGLYKEAEIEILKPLTLKGINTPIISGQNKGNILLVKSDSVTISGFTIQDVGHSYTSDFAAIKVHRSNYCSVSNNILKKVFFGIMFEKSKDFKIFNNHVSGEYKTQSAAGNGVHIWHCSRGEIKNNHVEDLRDGIYLEFVSHSTIVNNHSHNNLRYGLHFMFSNHNSYTNNLFENNGAGVAVMFSKHIIMTKNIFKKNWGTAAYGLLLKEIYDAEINENLFEENTIAINLEGCTRINYTNNNFKQNGWALKVAGACYANVFTKNNFLNNAFDVSYNSKMNDNSFEGNYWSSYTGYDLDKNGIGDIPYRPVKLFSYIVNRTPETIILLRSLFVDIINFSEKVSPVFTPDDLVDKSPLMKKNK